MALKSKPKVAILGSGVAGLVAALELAARGWPVTIYERADRIGGKIRSEKINGRSLDVGPTVLTMRWVIEQIFQDVGAHLSEHLTLTPSRLVARHAWARTDGEKE